MSTDNLIFEKTVIITEIRFSQEVITGDPMHQVFFGEYIQLSTTNPNIMPNVKTIPTMWLTFNVKTKNALPYKVGSLWKFTVNSDGTTQLVELK